MEYEKEDSFTFTREPVVERDAEILVANFDNYDIISSEVLEYFVLINYWGPGLVICVLGIVTNVLNIITFSKYGMRDTVTISLLGLATSDLGSQIALFLTNICFIPGIDSLGFVLVVSDFRYIAAWCRVIFTRITTWITSYITLERCLCVAFPLKVKNIFTPKRAMTYLVVVYCIMLVSAFPMFYTARSTWIFDQATNTSLLGLSFIEDRNDIENIAFTTNNAIPNLAFILVIVCTAVLVSNLQAKSKWRQLTTASNNSIAMSERDAKVVKMVVLVSTLFIVCYLPGAAAFIWMILDPEMRLDGMHANLLYAVFSVLFNIESINASLNIFIYLRMSSKFKKTFIATFSFRTEHKKIDVRRKNFSYNKEPNSITERSSPSTDVCTFLSVSELHIRN